MEPLRLLATYESAEEFLEAYDQEASAGGLFVRGAEVPAGTSLSGCTLAVSIAGEERCELPATLASVAPGVGVSVIFLQPPEALHELAAALRAPPPEEAGEDGGEAAGEPAAEPAAGGRPRPARAPPNISEKFALALHGDREERMALLRDTNKQLHPLVLKNPRIGLEEVSWAARQVTLNPDALKAIAEHPEWGQNAGIATALVRNPKTPVPVALRLLPRVPYTELKAIARSQGRPQIVQGAKRLLVR